MEENTNQDKNSEPIVITKKELLNHFLLFRFIGSIVLFLVVLLILDFIDRSSAEGAGHLLISFGVIIGFNIFIQLYYLLKATYVFFTQKTKK